MEQKVNLSAAVGSTAVLAMYVSLVDKSEYSPRFANILMRDPDGITIESD